MSETYWLVYGSVGRVEGITDSNLVFISELIIGWRIECVSRHIVCINVICTNLVNDYIVKCLHLSNPSSEAMMRIFARINRSRPHDPSRA